MSSPADVSEKVQAQISYLLSLSKEKEYLQLVGLAADVEVGVFSECF
jgi:hypothetical protein